mmetsp:Transcript_9023/g.16776  ORF Transcript_9023/g.16776 Transcript_9023/m.16776 type:complete len:218 (+) Transcript_9023:2314-2967(+)
MKDLRSGGILHGQVDQRPPLGMAPAHQAMRVGPDQRLDEAEVIATGRQCRVRSTAQGEGLRQRRRLGFFTIPRERRRGGGHRILSPGLLGVGRRAVESQGPVPRPDQPQELVGLVDFGPGRDLGLCLGLSLGLGLGFGLDSGRASAFVLVLVIAFAAAAAAGRRELRRRRRSARCRRRKTTVIRHIGATITTLGPYVLLTLGVFSLCFASDEVRIFE